MSTNNNIITTMQKAIRFAEAKRPPARFTVRIVGADVYGTFENELSKAGFRCEPWKHVTCKLPEPKDNCAAVKTEVFLMSANGFRTETLLEYGFLFKGKVLMPYTMNGRTFGFTTLDGKRGNDVGTPKFTNRMTKSTKVRIVLLNFWTQLITEK